MAGKIKHGIIATIGFLLSPLSWWKDLIINIPIAYAIGTAVAVIDKTLFFPAVILGYWATNIAGMLLLSHGLAGLGEKRPRPLLEQLKEQLVWTLLYTAFIAVLIWAGILRFPTEYFQTN